MNWQTCIKLFNIPKLYSEASLENCGLIKKEIVDMGKRWLKSYDKPSLFMSGEPGSGKTYFSYALLHGLVEQGCDWVIYIKSTDLDIELLDSIENGQERDKLRKYTEVSYLFIDDLGTERVSERIVKQYFYIIDHRTSNSMSTVFSSNLDLKAINETLGDRITSRLGMTYQIKFPKEDLRKKIILPKI